MPVINTEEQQKATRHQGWPALALLMLLRCYKLAISPYLPQACRFHPTCSSYTAQAIEFHGALKGIYLGFLRICRCHPLHAGGYDPVPSPSAPTAGKGSNCI